MGETRLTDNQLEVLQVLEWSNHGSSCPEKWCTPLSLGGTNGSHHSNSLAALARKGFVQFKQRGGAEPEDGQNGAKIWRGRGAKCYRITNAGRIFLVSLKLSNPQVQP